MKKLNILVVCDAVIRQVGGAFISPLRFSELLKKRGHNVILLAAKYPDTPEIDYYNGIKVYRFRSFALPKFEKLIRLAMPKKKEIEKILIEEKIDLVHIMIPAFAAFSSIKSARKNNIKIVSHSHTQPENILLHLPTYLRGKLMINLIYWYLTRLYNKTDTTVCPSKFAERILKTHKPELKTKVISNGVDLSQFNKIKSNTFIKKYNVPKNSKLILFVGRLHPEKSVDTLIKSMQWILKKDKNVILGIVGKGYLRDSLEVLSKDLNLEKNVKFFGCISDEDLIQAYNSCDIFALPSLAELEGMVVLEAMACGKPILIANSQNSASVDFVEGNGLLFKPENPRDLAKKALIILKNDTLRKSMSEKSFKNIKDYDINKSIDKLEELYYSLLSLSSRGNS